MDALVEMVCTIVYMVWSCVRKRSVGSVCVCVVIAKKW